MMVAFVDLQGFQIDQGFIVKELAIRIDSQMSHFLFKSPVLYRNLSEKEKRNVKYVERRIHGLNFSFGYVDYYEIKAILWNHLKNVDLVFTNGHQKFNFLQNTFEELQLSHIQLRNLEHFCSKMEICTPACLNHRRGSFRCAINCVNIIYCYVNKNYIYNK